MIKTGSVSDNYFCESLRLVMVLNAHAEGVYEDAEEDPLLEETVVHYGVQTTPDPTQESADALQTGGETPEMWGA